jgi:hypothetical protein
MTRYFVDVEDDLAKRLKAIDEGEIIAVLEELAETHKSREEDELSPYDSIRDIREDDNLDEVKRKQLEIKAKRRSDISNR